MAQPAPDPGTPPLVRAAGDVPVVEAVGVTKVYRLDGVEVRALDGVDLVVERGDSMAIMGPSGSGKSTLLGLLGGLDRPTSGTLRFDGRALSPLSKREMARYRLRSVGMIFQNFNLITSMTAAENVELALAFGGLAGRERAERARELLGRVGLAERADHRPTELSGGEQQRVAIARALVTEPAMLLADEPTGNLDSRSGEEVLELLARLHAERGVAVVVVTHDPGVAARFRRRVTLRDGRVVDEAEAAR